MRLRRGLLLGALVAIVASCAAPASSLADVALSPIGGSFDNPMLVSAPPGDTHRQFVLEQNGSIWLVIDGVRQAQPFLTVPHAASEGKGTYSMVFAPDYATSGLFYVYERRWDTSGGVVSNVRMRVEEFSRSAADPNLADPASQRTIVTTDELPRSLHLGGHLVFGPDGMLYVSTGDGDDFGNPDHSAQRLDSLRGKLLRLDPRPSGSLPYTVPAGNPYPDLTPPLNLIYARGLRNPWRFAFEAAGGILIADPGESRREEIDYSPQATLGGANFGWNCFEGSLVFDTTNSCPGALAPILEYAPSGPQGCGAAVIGGFVVRDPGLPELLGRYLYGDYCTGQLRSFLPCGGAAVDDRALGPLVPGLNSFGEDGAGHVYAAIQPNGGTGSVARLTQASASAGVSHVCPAGAGAGSGADHTAPRISGFALGSSVFRAASKGGAIARKRVPVGTRVRFRLSEKATARFTFERAARGRRKGHRCVAPKKAKRGARSCRRYVSIKGGFSRRGKAGLNGFRFSGRLRGRKLRPARYRLVLVSRDGAGNRSAAKRAKFRIVRR